MFQYANCQSTTMQLKEKLTSEPGFSYVIDAIELMSAAGRRCMMAQPLMKDADLINAEYDNIDTVRQCLADNNAERATSTIRHQLMQMHDVQGTLNNLEHKTTLEEIELFEIKSLAFLCVNTAKAANSIGIAHLLSLPDTSSVFNLLDPDNTGIPNFYIYDSYHPELPAVRKQLKELQAQLDSGKVDAEQGLVLQRQIGELFEKHSALQQTVITRLSAQLAEYHSLLQLAYDRMAYTDLLFAKATLANSWNLCRPKIEADLQHLHTQFAGLWNPRLRHRIEAIGQRYQPVDITLYGGVCLITGANMAGKTVLLKTVGIAQLLAQFGFFVPAESATVSLVDDIVFCIGDEQNEMNGLSSFASEITKISDTLVRARTSSLLVLIDEPARTTNPIEGKAIVQSIASLLDKMHSMTLITTHYSQLALPCRRLRVKGFVENMVDIALSPDNINRFMDYSLLPDDSDDVPQEALRIASILQCDADMLDTARRFIGQDSAVQ